MPVRAESREAARVDVSPPCPTDRKNWWVTLGCTFRGQRHSWVSTDCTVKGHRRARLIRHSSTSRQRCAGKASHLHGGAWEPVHQHPTLHRVAAVDEQCLQQEVDHQGIWDHLPALYQAADVLVALLRVGRHRRCRGTGFGVCVGGAVEEVYLSLSCSALQVCRGCWPGLDRQADSAFGNAVALLSCRSTDERVECVRGAWYQRCSATLNCGLLVPA